MTNNEEIKDYIKKLDILKEYCTYRKEELERYENIKREKWEFVKDEIRLWCTNLFNTDNEYDYIVKFFQDERIAKNIIKFDKESDRKIKAKFKDKEEIANINNISNAICSSEYMFTLFNKAGQIELPEEINSIDKKNETFIFDSTLIVADYFKAIELYLCKKIYMKYPNEKIQRKGTAIKVGDENFFTKTMLGDYINLLKNNKIDNETVKLLNKWKKESRNAYLHKDYLKNKEKVIEIRKKTRELFKKLEEKL